MLVFIFSIFVVIILIVFWTVVNGISPMPSSPKTKKCLLASLPPSLSGTAFELGAGWGTLAFPIAKKYPQNVVIACETSIIPYLFCRLRLWIDPTPNLRVIYKDIFKQSLQEAGLVVCYLYPRAMQKLKEKFIRELMPNTLVVSNTFSIPGWRESEIFDSQDLYHSKIYHYIIRTPDIRGAAITNAIQQLIKLSGSDPLSFNGDLIFQQIQNSLKLLHEGHDTGQLKLITRSLKEMRHAFGIFNLHKEARCVSIFGSARTPEGHPDYMSALEFSAKISSCGWMCITGGGDGIMKAGLAGAEREAGFGLSISLPFENTVNSVISGDRKLMVFRYFFTRKLMFLSHADAIAAFPGGYGTLDELFEVLTLIQTGKSKIVPVVLVEGAGGTYWKNWSAYIETHLEANGWISAEDTKLFYIAFDTQDAVLHIQQFYRRYHSSRYVKDLLIIRLQEPLDEDQLVYLNSKYSKLLSSGSITAMSALPEETDFIQLPRIAFEHTHKNFALLRAMIDEINQM